MSYFYFFLILLSGLLHAIWNTLLKFSGKNTTVLWLSTTLACIVISPFVIPHILKQDIMLLLKWSFFSGVIHCFYYFSLTYSYSKYSMSVIYPISRGCGVLIASSCGVLFFNDVLTPMGIVGMLTILIGIGLFSVLNSKSGATVIEMVFGIVVGICISGYLLFDFVSINYVEKVSFVFCLYFIMNVLILPYFLVFKRKELVDAIKTKKVISLVIGVCALVSYILILYVLDVIEIGYVVSLRETSIVFAALLTCFVLKERFSLLKWVAICCIASGAFAIKLS
jgi:multidrug transporter EmrE-like cation transporter